MERHRKPLHSDTAGSSKDAVEVGVKKNTAENLEKNGDLTLPPHADLKLVLVPKEHSNLEIDSKFCPEGIFAMERHGQAFNSDGAGCSKDDVGVHVKINTAEHSEKNADVTLPPHVESKLVLVLKEDSSSKIDFKLSPEGIVATKRHGQAFNFDGAGCSKDDVGVDLKIYTAEHIEKNADVTLPPHVESKLVLVPKEDSSSKIDFKLSPEGIFATKRHGQAFNSDGAGCSKDDVGVDLKIYTAEHIEKNADVTLPPHVDSKLVLVPKEDSSSKIDFKLSPEGIFATERHGQAFNSDGAGCSKDDVGVDLKIYTAEHIEKNADVTLPPQVDSKLVLVPKEDSSSKIDFKLSLEGIFATEKQGKTLNSDGAGCSNDVSGVYEKKNTADHIEKNADELINEDGQPLNSDEAGPSKYNRELNVRKFARLFGIKYYSEYRTYCALCREEMDGSIVRLKIHIKSRIHKELFFNTPNICLNNYKTAKMIDFCKFIVVIRNNEGNRDMIINDIIYSSFACYHALVNEEIGVKCYVCKRFVNDVWHHVEDEIHKRLWRIGMMITSFEKEFVRELYLGIYHCGFCNIIFKEWNTLIIHLMTLPHRQRRRIAKSHLRQHLLDRELGNCEIYRYV